MGAKYYVVNESPDYYVVCPDGERIHVSIIEVNCPRDVAEELRKNLEKAYSLGWNDGSEVL